MLYIVQDTLIFSFAYDILDDVSHDVPLRRQNNTFIPFNIFCMYYNIKNHYIFMFSYPYQEIRYPLYNRSTILCNTLTKKS